MQIKPHQIPHFARQRERLAEIRNSWNAEPKEEVSYFSRRFKIDPKYINAGAAGIFADLSAIDIQRFYVDSHDDIHVKGCWSKSIIENRLNR